MKGKFKTGDIIVISAALISAIALSICLWFPSKNDAEAIVLSVDDNKEYYPLNEDRSFSVKSKGYTLEIEIKDGSACVKHSDCPDNTCVHTGRISKGSQIIACIPAGVTLTVPGEELDYDFVAG